MNLAPSELLVILVLLGGIVLPIAALVDMGIAPEPSFAAAGYSKTALIVIQAVTLLLPIVALGVALVWFLTIRRKVHTAPVDGT